MPRADPLLIVSVLFLGAVAWLIAFVYSGHASRHFDSMAAEIDRIAKGERA